MKPDYTKRYVLIHGTKAAELTKEVNEHLDNGYELYGEPFTRNHGSHGVYQAVVKPKVVDNNC